ncbi:hypothetical protein CC80DRAFT_535503 [Byssothecium circinans]|uniref:Uncharacterized protein n=1 Tax=Byssothecium circinans TaxID=147558 RepID=A0A6A5TVR0_9PLEO|nr:hypothetical protein CC80DRAFT_535503 [Byssothecium circinans]
MPIYLSSNEEVPPPYSVSSPALAPANDIPPRRHRRPPVSAPPRSPLAQLQRYLIEIVTYTLDADFGLVRQALGQDEPATDTGSSQEEEVDSILADDEKKELFRLATIILDLYHKYKTNRWNLTLDCDRAAILAAIVKPAKSMYINEDYILDMISTYAEENRRDATGACADDIHYVSERERSTRLGTCTCRCSRKDGCERSRGWK